MPAEATPVPFALPTASDPTDLAERPSTILVGDDDADTRHSLAELLEENGYAVILAEDGQEAFDYLAKQPPPACVVLDLWMPIMDGWSLASQVLIGNLPSVPILVVTAAGAQFADPVPPRYVLRKPVSTERLLMLLAELIETRPTGPVE
jgi:CheY-like chemotaxis protein